MKKTKKINKIRRTHKLARSGDIPVTKDMLDEARFELKHEITSVKLELSAKIAQVDAKVQSLDGKIQALEMKFDSKFQTLDSKIETVLAAVHRIGLLVEEQNARNKFVLDGYTSLNDRLEKVERKSEENL